MGDDFTGTYMGPPMLVEGALEGVSQKHSGTPLLWLQSLGWTSQQRPLRTSHQGEGSGEADAWLVDPCPLMSMNRAFTLLPGLH